MLIEEVVEGATQIFGRSGGKIVKKYRCTTGSRKGRIVAKPSTCTAPKRVKASQTMKKTRRSKTSAQSIKSRRTKKYSPISRRVKKINRQTASPRRKTGRGKKI